MWKSLVDDLKYTLDPVAWLESLGFNPFVWQRDVFESEAARVLINGARQSGKSLIISSLAAHTARFYPGSLTVILAATEKQAIEDMEKIKSFIGMDPDYPKVIRDSDSLLELANGSRIVVIPATEKGARGFSSPRLIILDEASRIEDPVYQSGVRAMLTANKQAQLIVISTPNGRRGFFARAYKSERWTRFEVYAPWDVKDGRLKRTAKIRSKLPGVRYYVSPRHEDQEEMEEHLAEMDELMFRQEYLVEFVEPEDQVFGYDDIERMVELGKGLKPLVATIIPESMDVKPLRGL